MSPKYSRIKGFVSLPFPTLNTVLLPVASGGVVSHITKIVDLPRLAIRGLDQEFHDGGDSAGMFLMETVAAGGPELVTKYIEDVVVELLLRIDRRSSHLSFF